ncbi:MAG TPA: ATP-binding protein [Polyangiaceae bacterium]|nr:ATP-binding protein [Polyangiaceae bacterium]
MTPRAMGIRLQIVLALGGLLVLAFVPLFLAVAALTRATVRAEREASARSIGRAVAALVEEARRNRGDTELRALLDSEIGAGGVAALGVYDEKGAAVFRVGDPDTASALPPVMPAGVEHVRQVATPRGPALEVAIPGASGVVAAVVRTDVDAGGGTPLFGLLGLYTGLFALALLTFAYIALTRLIVRPLDAISATARRVAAGGRAFEPPATGPAELRSLAESLSEMTANLRADEHRMRAQIEELERSAEKLREAQDRLIRTERLASVGRLSAGLAHEIGNPIAALLGLEDLLLQGGLTADEEQDFLKRIKSETERIHRVLRDLLDFARPAAAAHRDDDKPGDVAEAIADVVALVRPQRSFRQVDLRLDAEPHLPQVTLGNERLMQVLLNLLLNAADAVDAKGVVTVAAHRSGTGVRLTVEDNGPGIDPAVRARLFEPFVTTKEVGKGTGLGLAVCRGLVESARGTIQLDESYEGGARFLIELPSHSAREAVAAGRQAR